MRTDIQELSIGNYGLIVLHRIVTVAVRLAED